MGAEVIDHRLPAEEEKVIDDALLAMKKQPLRACIFAPKVLAAPVAEFVKIECELRHGHGK